MKTSQQASRRSQRGFSLIEMMVVVLILTIVMAVVFTDIANVQKRYRAEETKLDLTQESREFLDQIVRDLRQAGYPNSKLYGLGVLGATPDTDTRNAAGLVAVSPLDIVFEGDMDQDGVVDSVRYTLTPDVGATCPCTVRRSQVVKVAGDPRPISMGGAQATTYQAEVQNVINSGNTYALLGTTTIRGVVMANDGLYAAYKPAPLFEAFDRFGDPVALPLDISTKAGKDQVRLIKQIRVNMNVLAAQGQQDLQTGMRPAVAMTATARLAN